MELILDTELWDQVVMMIELAVAEADMVVEEMMTLMEAEAVHLFGQMSIVHMYLAITAYQ